MSVSPFPLPSRGGLCKAELALPAGLLSIRRARRRRAEAAHVQLIGALEPESLRSISSLSIEEMVDDVGPRDRAFGKADPLSDATEWKTTTRSGTLLLQLTGVVA